MSLPIYQRVAVTDAGDVIPGAEYTVINENTGVAAPIYSDRTGATLLTAPYFADSAGTIQFFIAQGTTFRVAASGGVGTYTDRYVYGVAEAVLVQANGNVGIGNSDPAVPLDVRKAGGGNFIANFQNTTAGTPYGVSIKDAVSGASGYPLLQVTNSAGSAAYFKVNSGNGGVNVGGNINLSANDTYVGFPSNGIYYNNSADHVSVKTGAVERVRIDSAGNVGIGTTNPNSLGSNITTLNIKGGVNDRTGGLRLTSLDNSVDGYMYGAASLMTFGTQTATPVRFLTSGSERMRIDAAGHLLVGITSSLGQTCTVRGDTNTTTEGTIYLANNGGAAAYASFGDSAGTITGYIQKSGSGVNYASISDKRLKENITDSNDAGSKIDAIQVRQYDWKADGSHQDYGMIAQELISVAPDAVSGSENTDDMMGVDFSKLVPMLIKEVQSLRARVAALESI